VAASALQQADRLFKQHWMPVDAASLPSVLDCSGLLTITAFQSQQSFQ